MQKFEGCDLKNNTFFCFQMGTASKFFCCPRPPSISLHSAIAPTTLISLANVIWVDHDCPPVRQTHVGALSTEIGPLNEHPLIKMLICAPVDNVMRMSSELCMNIRKVVCSLLLRPKNSVVGPKMTLCGPLGGQL